MRTTHLELSREQILAFRRRVAGLDVRSRRDAGSLRRAAWAGLQDSMPRAALLSLHARIEGTRPGDWEHRRFVQLWGPRYSAYVVADEDLPWFSLGRLPDAPKQRRMACEIADRLEEFLAGRRMSYAEAGRALGMPPNRLRYAAATGRVLIRWDGARRPLVWTVPAPDHDPAQARLELGRRYLHVFGPTTPASFAAWAGIPRLAGVATFDALRAELLAVSTPRGDGWALASDEASLREPPAEVSAVRLLPSGDSLFLLQGADRAVLVGNPRRMAELWTSRVWPGAVLVGGEVAGTWRRSKERVTITPWGRLDPAVRRALEAETASLPLPDIHEATIDWAR